MELTKITLHGDIGEQIGKVWNLSVESAGEALHAINVLTKQKLIKYLIDPIRKEQKFKTLINNKEINLNKKPEEITVDDIKSSDFAIRRKIKTIDIIPIVEGGDTGSQGILATVLGVVLIVVGIILVATGVGSPFGAALIVGGLGLAAAGIMTLLAKPPDLGDISAPNATKASYLFNGPVNTVQDGGPVPLVYGRMLVGSQVIQTTYDIYEVSGGEFIDGLVYDQGIGSHYSSEGLVLGGFRRENGGIAGGILSRSTTNIKIIDLISEGPIGGLVYERHDFTGLGIKGNVGYESEPVKTSYATQFGTGTNIYRSIFLNQVPMLNDVGQSNYQQATAGQIYGYSSATEFTGAEDTVQVIRPLSEKMVAELGPRTYRIYNSDCTGFRLHFKIVNLATILVGDKDSYYSTLEFHAKIEWRPVYSNLSTQGWSTGDAIYTGYITQGYMAQIAYAFPPLNEANRNNFIAWEIRITKVSKDTHQQTDVGGLQSIDYRSNVYLDSIVELYTTRLTYPNCAIVISKFDSEFFSSVPQRAFEIWGKKVKVPTNYAPNQRRYTPESISVEWSGTFTTEPLYTNNPAWVYYDLITNRRYGLGSYLLDATIDKWTLYEIAKYCDTLVDDGYGGLEPRFTCNLALQSRNDAYKVINDLASVFNAITYYAGGTIYAVQDRPKDPLVAFTNANVEGGNFNYTSSSKRNRHTVAVVRWNDPNNFYLPNLEYVEDLDNIRKFGVKQVDMTAFACTSRGQAIRLGRYVLLSENLETETINFITGLEGAYLRPGDVFKVFDKNRKTKRFAGRLFNVYTSGSNKQFILDNNINSYLAASTTYTLTLLTPGWNFDPARHSDSASMTQEDVDNIRKSFIQTANFTTSDVTTLDGRTKITLASSNFDLTNFDFTAPSVVWTIELPTEISTYSDHITYTDSNYDYYRVIKISEKENNKYEVFGLQYCEDKFAQVEDGLTFERPVNQFQSVPTSPTALVVSLDKP